LIDNEVARALLTAGVEMIVLSPFAACSPTASSCTIARSEGTKQSSFSRSFWIASRALANEDISDAAAYSAYALHFVVKLQAFIPGTADAIRPKKEEPKKEAEN
jgi:hypothetical protein